MVWLSCRTGRRAHLCALTFLSLVRLVDFPRFCLIIRFLSDQLTMTQCLQIITTITDSTLFFCYLLFVGRFRTRCALKADAQTDGLLHAAVVAVIFEPQTHFGSVFLEVKKLFGVEGSTSLPTGNKKQERSFSSKMGRHTLKLRGIINLLE